MTTDQALEALRAEIARARAKFPNNDRLFEALAEEVGEAFRALDDPNGRCSDVDKELIQVACVAIRIVTEGNSTETNRTVIELARAMEIVARMVLEGQKEAPGFLSSSDDFEPIAHMALKKDW